jgi:erythromycin esterase
MDPRQSGNAIIEWLQQTAVPIRHLSPGNGLDDLQLLKRIFDGVQVVGLGEATHGTREFFLLKRRLLEFLVLEMGFTVFAMEASHAACQPINDYVLRGVGERDEVLTGQGYLAWCMEEFAPLLDWMRDYNRSVSSDRKVEFWGTDVTWNENGRRAVLEVLRRGAPDHLPVAEATFRVLAEEESKWPMRIDDASTRNVEQVLPDLDRLIAVMGQDREAIAVRASAPELERARFLACVMRLWWTEGVRARSRHMGENLLHLIDRDRPGARVVYWAHNCHVGVETFPCKDPTAGYMLRQRYGDAYYACALEFEQGSYQTRTIRPDGFLGEFKVDAIGSARKGSFPWYMAKVDLDPYFVDLRAPSHDPAVGDWLDDPRTEHGGTGWTYGADPESSYEPVTVGQQYDGAVFVHRSTPTHPTGAALDVVARLGGF